ncbi:MAG: NAD-binding protein [bacterium]
MLFVITFVAIVGIGVIAFLATGNDESIFRSVWISFMQTLDAGNLSDAEGSFFYVFMMTVSTIVGIFVTSMLISIISNGFQSRLENLQKGTSQVIEKNHTLILGWNDNVPVIVGELVDANRSVKRPVIVILSENDIAATADSLKQLVKRFENTKVIIRKGSIHDQSSLEMCAIDQAKSVIVSDVDDVETIQALLAIRQTAFCREHHHGFVSAIFTSRKNLKIAQDICHDKLEAIHVFSAMNRIMAQTCLQPGLSFVYKELFDFQGDEFYFFRDERLAGMTVDQVANCFNKSAFVGLCREGKVLLNPHSSEVLQAHDQVIVISEDDDTIRLDGTPSDRFDAFIVHASHSESRAKRNILSIGYNDNTLCVIQEMLPFVMAGTHVTFLTPMALDSESIDRMQNDDAMMFDFVVGPTYDRETLDQLNYADIDTIIVFANNPEDGERSDSETLLTVLNLKKIEEERHLDIAIIIEIEENRNEAVLQYASVDDFIISNVLSNKMLCQIAENRHLNQVFGELLDEKGSEIYLKHAENYVMLHEPVDFYAVVKSALLKKEMAIGYKIKSVKENGGVVINPMKDDLITFSAGDCIILLAQD